MPTCEWIICCDTAAATMAGQKPCLIGLFDVYNLQSVPAAVPPFMVACHISGKPNEMFSCRVELVGPPDAAPVNLAFETGGSLGPQGQMTTFTQFPPVEFKAFGVYTVKARVGDTIKNLPLVIQPA